MQTMDNAHVRAETPREHHFRIRLLFLLLALDSVALGWSTTIPSIQPEGSMFQMTQISPRLRIQLAKPSSQRPSLICQSPSVETLETSNSL